MSIQTITASLEYPSALSGALELERNLHSKGSIHSFYRELSLAKKPKDKLTAIARCYQMLEWLHAPKDGTGRCDMAILNKLLTESGFHPVILNNPYFSSNHSLSQWTKYLQSGLIEWELYANRST